MWIMLYMRNFLLSVLCGKVTNRKKNQHIWNQEAIIGYNSLEISFLLIKGTLWKSNCANVHPADVKTEVWRGPGNLPKKVRLVNGRMGFNSGPCLARDSFPATLPLDRYSAVTPSFLCFRCAKNHPSTGSFHLRVPLPGRMALFHESVSTSESLPVHTC